MSRILIVDDDVDFCLLVSKFLNQNGYETQIATSGETALMKMKNFEFSAALCDFRLGDMNGKELLLNLKELNIETVVIFMTGYADQKTASDLLAMGAYDYLSKPLIPGEILLALSQAFSISSLRSQPDHPYNNRNNSSVSSNSFML